MNFGIKGGFTSSLFLVSDLVLNGTVIDEVQNNYKIGYFGSFFMRINFKRHFLQPELSYTINRCNITFEKPLPEDAPESSIPEMASITSSIHSFEIPVIYGYNIIKEGPYSLAVFGGPKIRYIWDRQSKVTFENFDQRDIEEELYPLNVSLTAGVAVTISASSSISATTSDCTTFQSVSATSRSMTKMPVRKCLLPTRYVSIGGRMF